VPDTIKTVSFSEFSDMDIKEIRRFENNIYEIYLTKKVLDVFNLSLDELSAIKVISASNIVEKHSDVPATMIVISDQEIVERGYQSITEVFSDLPGMDISQHYGELSVFNYWRGFRTAYSQPYIFMIDGMSCNNIFYNQPQVIDNIPLSNIEKIEIVYGPVSAVYGANAFMGVINVITNKNAGNGVFTKAKTSMSANADFMGDFYTHYQKGKIRTSLAVRAENTNLSHKIDLNNDFTNKNLLADNLLWGDLAKSVNTDGVVSFPQSGKSIDFRMAYDKTEFGFQANSILKGNGLGTPFDKYIANLSFTRNFYYTWLKHEHQLSDKLSYNISLRYMSEIRKRADYIEGYNYTNNSTQDVIYKYDTIKPNETARLIDYSIWPLKNEKISCFQKFTLNLKSNLLFTTGLQYDQTYITKQEGVYGDPVTPENVNIDDPDFYPNDVGMTYRPTNRVIWTDYGVFSQVKYTIFSNHILNIGLRVDNNSVYGVSPIFRGGYVFHLKRFTAKFLYGQAYQVPTPRTLYSSETLLGSSPDLSPEKSETMEVSLNYTAKKISGWLSTYYIRNNNTIVFVNSKAENLAKRNVMGIDGYVNLLNPVDLFKRFNVWGYYSFYLLAEEDVFNDSGEKTGIGDIGDLSPVKLYFGTTTYFTDKLLLNLRGRYISERKAVSTNITDNGQKRIIPSYFTMDANITYQNIFTEGLSLALKVDNLLNTEYYHPGINLANSGTGTGFWNEGVWNGSAGWNNSVLPQPHRCFMLSLLLEL